MELDQQVQELIDNAPQDGKTSALVVAISPALKAIAGQLQHKQYYVLKTEDEGWVVTPLSHRSQPSLKKKVIYAYPTLVDAKASFPDSKDSKVLTISIPVIHILFQMLAMKTVDSTVFFETPKKLDNAIEVTQQRLASAIKQAYKNAQSHSQPPSDIA